MDIPTIILFSAVIVVLIGLTTICMVIGSAFVELYRYLTRGDSWRTVGDVTLALLSMLGIMVFIMMVIWGYIIMRGIFWT